MITTKAGLQYIMKFYGIPYIKLTYKGRDMGRLEQDMFYRGGYAARFNHTNYAIDCAIDTINKYYDKLPTIKDLVTKQYESRLIYKDGKEQSFSKTYCWKSDFDKTNVTYTHNENGEIVLRGTAMPLAEFIRYARNHYSYCNGTTQELENEELKNDIVFLKTFGVTDNYDMYHIGIVD